MRIVIYEYLSGGGYAEKPIPPGILAEGFGMLRCLAADFKNAGHEVTVFLDDRVSKLNPPLQAHATVPIFYADEPKMFLPRIAEINDLVYVVAPETDQTLQSLVKLVEATGKASLNCTSNAITAVSDKSLLYGQLQKHGFLIPKTTIMKKADSLEHVKRTIEKGFLFPVVFKPTDGTSCGGISLVRSRADVEKALNKIKSEFKSDKFIIQEFISGEPASVSLICNGTKAAVLGLNKQIISLNAPSQDSCYQGGVVPFDNPMKQEAFAVAQKAVELFSGLRGYVGVDVILGQNDVYVLDLNPRLTSSYIGLREVMGVNVGQALVDAVIENKLPTEKPSRGFCYFIKAQTSKPSVEFYQKAAADTAITSPPFPFTDSGVALLHGCGLTVDSATRHLEEAKKSLRSIMC